MLRLNWLAAGVVVAASVLFSQPAWCQQGTRTVQRLVTRIGALSPSSGGAYRALSGCIDYAGISRRLVTRAQWNSLSASERRKLVSDIEKLIETRYYPRWHKLYAKGQVTYLGESAHGGEIRVRSKLFVGKSKRSIEWRLHERGGTLMVTDLNVDGEGLVNRLRPRVQERLSMRRSSGDT